MRLAISNDRVWDPIGKGISTTARIGLAKASNRESEAIVAYDGQHIASVLILSCTDVTTVVQSLGQVMGPKLTTVCPWSFAFPRRPCSHHVVTAGGAHMTLGSMSKPYPGSKATRLGPLSRY